jgi:hypothetical protein
MNIQKILKAGLIVGSLDIIAALLQYYIKTGKNPGNVLKFIASGVFGKEAFSGGTTMVTIGLLLHFVIAFIFTFFFFWIIYKIPAFSKQKILTGILYGLFIWSVMNFIVVPLSNTPPLTFKLTNALLAMGILIVCIGIPLSFMAGGARSNRFIS